MRFWKHVVPTGTVRGVVLAATVLLASRAAVAQELDHLLRPQDYTAHRVSSEDPTGGNRDYRRIEAGRTLTLAELDGPAVITHIWFTYNYPSRSALRKLVLRIFFDDLAEPCVEAPLGDFFGLGHAQRYAYASLPLAVGTNGGLNCYWPMPLADNARLTLTNEGAQDCHALYYQIDYRKLDKPQSDGLHFHAAYRQAFPCEKEKPYLILQTDGGPGHFVGCNLSIEQQVESWWGEGDVRIFVDGQAKPAIAGTGSEDDFGGAWCYRHEFSFPQFGAPFRARFDAEGVLERCTPDLRGKELQPWQWPNAWKPGDLWNVYRYHVSDPVPFRRSIEVNIEHGSVNNEQANWYSSVAYWYQAGRPSSRPPMPPVADRLPGYLRPHDYGDGRWEGEDLVDVAQASAGSLTEVSNDIWGDEFSRKWVLEWNAVKPSDTLSVPFTVAEAGRYKIAAWLGRSAEGGAFRIALDDLVAGKEIGLYGPPPFVGRLELPVAEAELPAGSHALKFTCLTRDRRSKGNRLMLDKFQVVSTPSKP